MVNLERNTKIIFRKYCAHVKKDHYTTRLHQGRLSKRMGEFDSQWRESTLWSEEEEELCKALSNFSIDLKEINIKPPKLQVRIESVRNVQNVVHYFCAGSISGVPRGAAFA